MLLKKSALIFSAAIAILGGAHGAIDLKHFPADTELLLEVNLADARGTAAEEFMLKLFANNDKSLLPKDLRIDPKKDIDALALFSNFNYDAAARQYVPSAVAIYGRFDLKQLASAFAEKAQTGQWCGVTILTLPPSVTSKSTSYLALVSDSLLIASDNGEYLKVALETVKGKRQSLAQNAAFAQHFGAKAEKGKEILARMLATGIDHSVAAGEGDTLTKRLRRASMMIIETREPAPEQTRLVVSATAVSPEDATTLAQILVSLKSVMTIQNMQNPEALEIINAIDVRNSGRDINLTLQAPTSKLGSLFKINFGMAQGLIQ